MNRKVTPVDVEVDGIVFSCFYSVQSDIVTVWHVYLGSRTRVFAGQLDHAVVEALAVDLFKASRKRISSATVASR